MARLHTLKSTVVLALLIGCSLAQPSAGPAPASADPAPGPDAPAQDSAAPARASDASVAHFADSASASAEPVAFPAVILVQQQPRTRNVIYPPAQPRRPRKQNFAGPLPVFNRVTFHGNVHAQVGNVEDWFVMFCVEWHKPCQALRKVYHTAAPEYERDINGNAWLNLPVRFVEVDCTVDKVLCNEQNVKTYPTLVHYRRGTVARSWAVNGGDMQAQKRRIVKFLNKETADIRGVGIASDASIKDTAASADFPGAATASESSVARNSSPADQEGPISTAFRLVPLAIAIVGAGVWALTHGLDYLHHIRSSSQPLGDADPLRSEAGALTHGADFLRQVRDFRQRRRDAALHTLVLSRAVELRRRLPESWTSAPRSIEL